MKGSAFKRDLIVLGFGKVLQVIVALASIKLLTVMLSQKEVGNYYLLLSVLSLFNFSFLNPLSQYYGRHLIHWRANENILNATIIILILRMVAIILSVSAAFFIFYFFEYEKHYEIENFLFFIFLSLVAGVHGVLLSAVNNLGDRISFTIYGVLTLAVGLLFSVFMILFNNASGMGWLYGVAISQLIFSVFLYRLVVKNNSFSLKVIIGSFRKTYVKKVFFFVVPVAVTLFFQWGQSQSYRFIVESKYSIEALAFIGVGLAISAALFGVIESLATQYYNPLYLRKITHANTKDRAAAWNELANYMMPIYLVFTLYVIALSPYLTKLLVASKFHDSYVYVMIGAVIEFFRVAANLVYKVSQSEVKTNTTVIPYAVGFIFTISSLLLFDMSQQLWGIPLLIALANGIILFFLFKCMKKMLNIQVDFISLVKSFVFAAPLCLTFLIKNNDTLLQSLLVVALSSVYLLFILGIMMKHKLILWR